MQNNNHPRTDAAQFSATTERPESGEYELTVVYAEDARQLETELTAANARIAELEKLVSENAADSLKWRNLFQNERDHMNAAQEEINRMTHNQRMQDSITAQVMERAEKAEKELQKLNKCSYMGPMRDCPTHGDSQRIKELEAENEVFKSLYLNEQGRSESLRVDAERYRWMKREVKRIPPGWGIIGWDAAIDAFRVK